MKNKSLLAYIAFNLCLLFFMTATWPRLRRELTFAGLTPGASVQTVKIKQKSHSLRKTFAGPRHEYWVSWTDEDIRKGPNRLSLTKEKWESLHVLDPVAIATAPGAEAVLLGGASRRGMLVLHVFLAALETAGAAASASYLLRRRRKKPRA